MPTETELLKASVQKLAQVVVGAEDVTGLQNPENMFVAFSFPGVAVDSSDLDFSFVNPSAVSSSAAADFSDFVNSVPPLAGRWLPTIQKTTDIYAEVLRDKQLPQVQLTQGEEARLRKAREIVMREIQTIDVVTGGAVTKPADTPLFEKYKELEFAYSTAAMAYRSLRVNFLYSDDPKGKTEWTLKGPILRKRVKAAYNAWLPVKDLVDQALATIQDLGFRGPALYWQELDERLEGSRFATPEGEEYLMTKYFPSRFWDDAHAPSWTKVRFSHEETHEINETSDLSVGGGGSFSTGLWSVSASGSYAEQRQHFKSDVNNASFELDVTMVALRRTWMDASVFWNRAWRFDSNINNSVISDGRRPPTGKLPAIATGMILGRNLKIGIDMNSTENSYFASQTQASASVGWGPFSVRGNYSRSETRKTHDFVRTAAGLEAPGMQILGFVCQLLPQCPNPDATLNWP